MHDTCSKFVYFVLQVKGGYTGNDKSDRRADDGKLFEIKIKGFF